MDNFTKAQIKNALEDNLSKIFGVQGSEASVNELYKACATTVNDILRRKRRIYNAKVREEKRKRVYYLSMEFLMGRSLKNNLYNKSIKPSN